MVKLNEISTIVSDAVGVVTKVEKMTLGSYLISKHGEKADKIMAKFSNLDRDHLVVTTEVQLLDEDSPRVIDAFFMIPKAMGFPKSNLSRFIKAQRLSLEVDTNEMGSFSAWVGEPVEYEVDQGGFLRLRL